MSALRSVSDNYQVACTANIEFPSFPHMQTHQAEGTSCHAKLFENKHTDSTFPGWKTDAEDTCIAS